MSITIHPQTKPDSYEIFSLGERAFTSINPVLFHTLPLSAASKEAISAARAQSFGANPSAHGFKAVDKATGKIVGAAQWVVHEDDEVLSKTVEEEVDGRLAVEMPERRVDCARAYYGMLSRGRRDVLGIKDGDGEEEQGAGEVKKLRKRVELVSLFVDPGYQRRGIARSLLAWGIGKAARLGLEMSLEATREGRRLYESVGFEVVKVEEFDARGFGVDIVDEIAFMVRPVGVKGGPQ
ncbi:acyl-CoA N-acyltransferase [Aspergillus karnatakaensis]|uniref:GNAT family N-acetyltransferase n=1 Tax=Aspergillus karnatakaensis TaxID=1810916 RepID=UPI003CCE3AD8